MQPWSQFDNHKFRLIGYSSDMYDVWESWYKYLVNGKERFYRQPFTGNGNEEFIGVVYAPPINFKPAPPKRDRTFIKTELGYLHSDFKRIKYSRFCCYCKVTLTPETRTKEHVIPKQRFGKIIRSACFECNNEKGNLMLFDYIYFLEYELKYQEVDSDTRKKTKIKITNAKALLNEINGKH